jgi:hypothetical protein
MDAATAVRRERSRSGLTQAELARRAGTSQAAVARYEGGAVSPSVATLERLLHAAGSRLELTTTPATPTDLSGSRAARVRRHRLEIIRLAKAAGATNVRIFGSVARGEDDEESDIDLLVDYDVTRGLIPLIGLNRELEELLASRVDVAPAHMLKPHIAKQALLEAVPL